MNRNLDSGHNNGKGMVYVDFSFLVNGASNPVSSSLRGTAIGDFVASIVHSATGKLTVTMKNNVRYIVTKYADLEDLATPDGSYATIGNVSGEGGAEGALTFQIATCVAAGTLTDFTGRRVSVSLCLKNSTVGV